MSAAPHTRRDGSQKCDSPRRGMTPPDERLPGESWIYRVESDKDDSESKTAGIDRVPWLCQGRIRPQLTQSVRQEKTPCQPSTECGKCLCQFGIFPGQWPGIDCVRRAVLGRPFCVFWHNIPSLNRARGAPKLVVVSSDKSDSES